MFVQFSLLAVETEIWKDSRDFYIQTGSNIGCNTFSLSVLQPDVSISQEVTSHQGLPWQRQHQWR